MFYPLISTTQVLEWVPKPVEAVLLVFPITEAFDKMRKSEDEGLQKDGQPHLDPTLFYIKQTVSGILRPRNNKSLKWGSMTSKIPNACGTIALLHSIYNVRTNLVGMQTTHQGPF